MAEANALEQALAEAKVPPKAKPERLRAAATASREPSASSVEGRTMTVQNGRDRAGGDSNSALVNARAQVCRR